MQPPGGVTGTGKVLACRPLTFSEKERHYQADWTPRVLPRAPEPPSELQSECI